jgi:hypothetical protein
MCLLSEERLKLFSLGIELSIRRFFEAVRMFLDKLHFVWESLWERCSPSVRSELSNEEEVSESASGIV